MVLICQFGVLLNKFGVLNLKKTFLIENFAKGENTGTKKGLVKKMQSILAQFSVQFNTIYITLLFLI